MSKYFVVTDVHGCYDDLIATLTKHGYEKDNKDHIFISCGDLLDRGVQPLETLRFVNSIPKDRKYLIYGNHEQLMEDVITRNYVTTRDYYNGTATTILCALGKHDDRQIDNYVSMFAELPEWKEYISSTQDFVEFGDFICVHGWIPCEEVYDHYKPVEDWRNKSFNWCRWYNGMNAWLDGVKEPGKTIICGHVKSEYGLRYIHQQEEPADFSQPFVDDGIIALDSHVFKTHKLNCLVIDI